MLKEIFENNKNKVWEEISNELGGEFKKGSFFKGSGLEFNYKDWIISLDTYTVMANNVPITYTRMRSPFSNREKFYFNIYRENIFSSFGKYFGLKDIIIGDDFFDKKFIIQSNDKDKIKKILKDEKLKELIQSQPKISFKIKDDEGWFGKYFPEGTDELYFECSDIIKEKNQIKSLFELFSLCLDILVKMKLAYKETPKIKI